MVPCSFIDQPCLALFERGDLRERLKVTSVGTLTELDEAADWLEQQQAALV